jgi:hypothetical protein
VDALELVIQLIVAPDEATDEAEIEDIVGPPPPDDWTVNVTVTAVLDETVTLQVFPDDEVQPDQDVV